jgi:integrase
MKLTAKTVAALRLGGKRDLISFDYDLPGFGYRLRVGAGGRTLRSWVVQYRRAGVSRRLLLGSADVLSAEQARAMAKKVLAKVALGEDPQANKLDRRDKDRLNLRSIVAEYLAAKETAVRQRTFVEFRRYLTDPRYFGPLLGMPVDTITRRDVAARVVVITRERGLVTAGRARSALSSLYVWALQAGIAEVNPVVGTAKPKESPSRDRVLSDAELVALWNGCDGLGDIGHIVRLLILMPYRRSEVGGMQWREIDLERGLFTLPTERSKNGKAHTLPLMPMALDVLKSVPRMATRDHLFGVRGNGFTRWVDGKAALDARSGVTDWVLHDVRRSVATRMADLSVPPHIIEQILNHRSGHKSGVAGIYNRSSYQREVRSALALWHDHVRKLIEGGERKVLPLHQTAS